MTDRPQEAQQPNQEAAAEQHRSANGGALRTTASGRQVMQVQGLTLIRKRTERPAASPPPHGPKRATPGAPPLAPQQQHPQPHTPPPPSSALLAHAALPQHPTLTPGARPLPSPTPLTPAQRTQAQEALLLTLLHEPAHAQQEQPDAADADGANSQLLLQLLQDLPPSCPTTTRLQLAVSHLLQQPCPAAPSAAAQQQQDGGDGEGAATLEEACRRVAAAFCTQLQQAVQDAQALWLQPAPAAPAAAGSPGATAATAPPPPQQQEGGQQEADGGGEGGAAPLAARYGQVAPMVRACVEGGPTLRALLSARLERLRREERAWEQLLAERRLGELHEEEEERAREQQAAEGPGTAEAAAAAAAPAEAVEGAGGGAGAGVEGEAREEAEEEAPCSELELAAVHALSAVEAAVLHVEGELSKGQLVALAAQQAAAELQVLHRAEQFSGLPVQTPRRLIRGLVALPPPGDAGKRLSGALQLATPI